MGCGTSKDGPPATAPATAQPPLPTSTATTPAAKPASQRPAAEAKPPAAKPPPQSSSAATSTPPKPKGARFNEDGGNAIVVEEKAQGGDGPPRKLKPIVSFQKDEKQDATPPFVKKGEGFEAMFEEDESDAEEEKKKKKEKTKKRGGGVNFDSSAQGEDGTKKGPAPGTPFVRLGAAFDDLYDEDEDEESESESDEDKAPAKPKGKKKTGGIKFDDNAGDEDPTKEKLAPGTPFVKMGGAFDDLYDEDEDMEGSEEDSDEDEPVVEQPKKKKPAGNKKAMFTDDTEEKDSKLKQPGTPFVKLGGFNDLYNEDDDEDSEEDEESDDEPPPQPPKKAGKKKAGFAADTEDYNAEDKDRVPGTPFVKLGGFNDLYDEEDVEDSDEDSDEDDGPSPPKPAHGAGPTPAPAPKGEPQDPSSMSMDLPAISKVRIA
eukprot:CAMPEP_0117659494 /NCGR_PEP_ID=MMETSP0804-20121206/6464_1 /TAXON_ID=1074897 /ORGANISM="Tetraselmis astigmatica, Strain CCMP880" /LENGTH=429 /DNA_ID=CAMNT_0005466159 /DNA_START=150 /DNA_END=1438 /DNA_ORIENTATION=+